MNVLESPKSDETELVPISSNKINIQGRNFTIFTKKLVIFGIFLWSPKKAFFEKIKTKAVFTRGDFFKMVFNEVTLVNLLNDICICYRQYH